MGEKEGALCAVGGERLEVRGRERFLRFQSSLEAEVAGSQRVGSTLAAAAVPLWMAVMASAIKH